MSALRQLDEAGRPGRDRRTLRRWNPAARPGVRLMNAKKSVHPSTVSTASVVATKNQSRMRTYSTTDTITRRIGRGHQHEQPDEGADLRPAALPDENNQISKPSAERGRREDTPVNEEAAELRSSRAGCCGGSHRDLHEIDGDTAPSTQAISSLSQLARARPPNQKPTREPISTPSTAAAARGGVNVAARVLDWNRDNGGDADHQCRWSRPRRASARHTRR